MDGRAFPAAADTPLVDLMFTVGHSLHGLRTEGAATIDFTENTYVIRLELVGDRVRFTASHDAPAPAPGCPLDTYACEARRFVTDGVEYLERQHPALARNPAMAALRELAGVRATPGCLAMPGAAVRTCPCPR